MASFSPIPGAADPHIDFIFLPSAKKYFDIKFREAYRPVLQIGHMLKGYMTKGYKLKGYMTKGYMLKGYRFIRLHAKRLHFSKATC